MRLVIISVVGTRELLVNYKKSVTLFNINRFLLYRDSFWRCNSVLLHSLNFRRWVKMVVFLSLQFQQFLPLFLFLAFSWMNGIVSTWELGCWWWRPGTNNDFWCSSCSEITHVWLDKHATQLGWVRPLWRQLGRNFMHQFTRDLLVMHWCHITWTF